jgi:hypothetical protein
MEFIPLILLSIVVFSVGLVDGLFRTPRERMFNDAADRSDDIHNPTGF